MNKDNNINRLPTPEEKIEILRKSEREYAGKDSFGNYLSSGKNRKKVTNFTKPKKKRKK